MDPDIHTQSFQVQNKKNKESNELPTFFPAEFNTDNHDPLDEIDTAITPNQTLPMIVWLTGTEPFFPDFDLTADQTMEILGIKRSRLTQISGRELRVGRKRIDRYIRPFYRLEDVTQYQEWTRATASHQKSSHMVQEAADKLHHNSTKLYDAFDTQLSVFDEGLGQISRQIKSLYEALKRQTPPTPRSTRQMDTYSLLYEKNSQDSERFLQIEQTLNHLKNSYKELCQTLHSEMKICYDLQTSTATQIQNLSDRIERGDDLVLKDQLSFPSRIPGLPPQMKSTAPTTRPKIVSPLLSYRSGPRLFLEDYT